MVNLTWAALVRAVLCSPALPREPGEGLCAKASGGSIYYCQQAKLHISPHTIEISLVVSLRFGIGLAHHPSATQRCLRNLNELCNTQGSFPYQEGLLTSEPQSTQPTMTTVQSENIQLILWGRAKNNPSFYFLIAVNISSSAALWSEHCEHPLVQG